MKNDECIICNTKTMPYFNKERYNIPNAEELTRELVPVEFHRCPCCGFVISKTHQNLTAAQWGEINSDFHHDNENNDRKNLGFNQPPFVEQAFMIELLARNNLIDDSAILDYASGYGRLSHILKKYYGREIKCYDKYIKSLGKVRTSS